MSTAVRRPPATVGKVRMKGREVFRHAVVNLAEVLGEVLEEAGMPGCGYRLGRAAPGQPAASSMPPREARPVDGKGRGDGRPARQHFGRIGAAGVRRGQERMGASNRATSSCSKRWAVALPGVQPCCAYSDLSPEKLRIYLAQWPVIPT